jgi:hypothetical protein
MLTKDNNHDKIFAQLINCFEKLQEFTNNHLYDIIINHVKNKKRIGNVILNQFIRL